MKTITDKIAKYNADIRKLDRRGTKLVNEVSNVWLTCKIDKFSFLMHPDLQITEMLNISMAIADGRILDLKGYTVKKYDRVYMKDDNGGVYVLEEK